MYYSAQPILRDFDTFLDYLGQSDKLELTKDKACLRTADLFALNERMHHQAAFLNPKAKQSAFSVLNTFFYIARAAELFLVQQDTQARKCTLSIQKSRVLEYRAMTPDEQYFFLLEGFWCFVNWDEAYDCRSFWDTHFYEGLLEQPVGKSVGIEDRGLKRKGEILSPTYLFAAEVLAAFGLFDLVWDKKLTMRPTKYDFPYQSAALTEIGKIMLPILMWERNHDHWGDLDPFMTAAMLERLEAHPVQEAWDVDLWEDDDDVYDDEEEDAEDQYDDNEEETLDDEEGVEDDEEEEEWDDDDEEEEEEGDDEDDDDDEIYIHALNTNHPYETAFDVAFRSGLPLLQIEKRLFPIERPFVPGYYTLRIALDKDCYREIQITTEATLDNLDEAIQTVFDFDHDSPYAFFLNGREDYYSGNVYADPRGGEMDGQMPADLLKMGELGLSPGREILYVFDFGDRWQFHIKVLSVEAEADLGGYYKTLKAVGEAPEQSVRRTRQRSV